jgi:hypothetical protein
MPPPLVATMTSFFDAVFFAIHVSSATSSLRSAAVPVCFS